MNTAHTFTVRRRETPFALLERDEMFLHMYTHLYYCMRISKTAAVELTGGTWTTGTTHTLW